MNDDSLIAAIEASGVAGAVAMVGDRNGALYDRAFGKRDVASGAAMALDSQFQIASMTKAITSVAVLQLVERGLVDLDAPVAALLPELANLQVLTGFSDGGQPILRSVRTSMTLRHLLTHCSGLGYEFMNADLLRCGASADAPKPGTKARIAGPLMFDPGQRWEYGTSTDWAGFAIEAATGGTLGDWFAEHILAPLKMADTGFWPPKHDRLATLYCRDAVGEIEEISAYIGGGEQAEFQGGGGALFSTGPDYLRFCRMILNGGELDGARILDPDSMPLLTQNQIGSLSAGKMASAMPAWTNPYDPFPGMDCNWSLAYLINSEPGPNGRSAGSLSWAGIANCYYWIDPAQDRIGIFLTQLLPFADPRALQCAGALERMAYGLDSVGSRA